jgi:hypothetical protein
MKTNGIARFFTFSIIIEGASKKALQFLMMLKPIYNKNFCFNEKKIYFECYKKGLNNTWH